VQSQCDGRLCGVTSVACVATYLDRAAEVHRAEAAVDQLLVPVAREERVDFREVHARSDMVLAGRQVLGSQAAAQAVRQQCSAVLCTLHCSKPNVAAVRCSS
jgi:hypothetical protein